MTLEELARLQAAFGAQISARTPDACALAPWLGADARGASALARYGQALRQHHARALELVYPVLRALGGASWFLGMAHAYGDAHPSRCADLARFGASLPVFLAAWPPAAAHGYFADVARLEWLLHEAHGAPDAAALTLRDVQAAGAGQVDAWQLALHPAAVLYRSPWRAAAIWLAHDAPGQHVMPPDAMGDTLALVYRSGWTARVREIDSVEAAALDMLAGGATLGAALAAAQQAHMLDKAGAPFTPAPLLLRWLADGVLVQARDGARALT
ncbi:hypothetical protein CSZ94_23745 [Janthinobacterium sp. ROICE36]|uniref:HvfC/BufC N-terminal domain-containing protein n=1 Tax=Janthinobacterium sp. ROICE36 TaxID=2048670 RepID=UPI000C7F6046|nr:DNA-binding domain-containing protein [Janthinobacterium sp. ROICE36]PLY39922.1 hypothetical protein CSZ94_23745 [Janthinobacterium sp. ROICE36]